MSPLILGLASNPRRGDGKRKEAAGDRKGMDYPVKPDNDSKEIEPDNGNSKMSSLGSARGDLSAPLEMTKRGKVARDDKERKSLPEMTGGRKVLFETMRERLETA